MRGKLVYILVCVCIVLLWQYESNASNTVRLLISSPRAIVTYFFRNSQDLLKATGVTLLESISGLLIAFAFSFGMMIFSFYKPKFMQIILPIMIVSQVIPLIVLAPFFTILLGIGLAPKIAMAALISFFPIFINFSQGYKAISKNIHELMLVYDAPIGFKIKKVFLPLSMPSIFAGLKVSANLAVIGAIVAEFSGTEIGIGKNLYISAIRLEPDLMMTSLLLAMFFGLAIYLVIKYIETKVVDWV